MHSNFGCNFEILFPRATICYLYTKVTITIYFKGNLCKNCHILKVVLKTLEHFMVAELAIAKA